MERERRPLEDESNVANERSSVRLTGKRKEYASGSADDRASQADRRRQVQIRLHHRHRVGQGAEGSVRGGGALYLGQEGGARMAAQLAARSLSPLAHHDRADLGERASPQDRLPGALLLLRAQEHRRAEEPGRRRSGAAADL